MTIAVVVIVTMGDLPYINIRILARNVRERQVSVCVCLLDIPPGVVAAMLTEGDGVLEPGLVLSDKVDSDVLPVVVVSTVHPQGVTASLEAVPEVPGQLEEISTADNLVVDRSRGVEARTLAVVTVGGLIWVTIVLGGTIKPQERSTLLVIISV